MKNPYEEHGNDESSSMGPRRAWVIALAFILLLLNPPLYRHLFEIFKSPTPEEPRWIPAVEFFRNQNAPGDPNPTLLKHLNAFNAGLEDKAAFTGPPRRAIQGVLVKHLREGNRKTFIGRDGWLFFRPALDALTGYGPLTPEPDSVAKDPKLPPWNGPREAIREFAAQLDAFGVELILVPIPVKPMTDPEHLTGDAHDGPIRHRDAEAFYTELRAQPNVEVLDLADDFWRLKDKGDVFLRQDTHWTPMSMGYAALALADFLRQRPWFSELEPDPSAINVGEYGPVASLGDLVEKLDLLKNYDPHAAAGPYRAEIADVQLTVGAGAESDPESPIILLGDSFTNIYDDANLHWGELSGFARHLAHRLAVPLDVIAINGQGATGVRATLARRRGAAELMRRKKAVVWAIATMRDLFLSKTVAQENEVEWRRVDFDTRPAPQALDAELVVEATLREKGDPGDPQKTTYANALYSAEYEVDRVVEGSYEEDRILVYHWAFRDRKRQPSWDYAIGDRRTLRLVPFTSVKEVRSLQKNAYEGDLLDDFWDITAVENDSPGDPNDPLDLGAMVLHDQRRGRFLAGMWCLFFNLAVLGIPGLAARRRAG